MPLGVANVLFDIGRVTGASRIGQLRTDVSALRLAIRFAHRVAINAPPPPRMLCALGPHKNLAPFFRTDFIRPEERQRRSNGAHGCKRILFESPSPLTFQVDRQRGHNTVVVHPIKFRHSRTLNVRRGVHDGLAQVIHAKTGTHIA